MKTRSALLYVPGVPYRLDALMPQRCLAVSAGCLIGAGHETRIWDYGTVEAMRRFSTPGFRAAAKEISSGWDTLCGGAGAGRTPSYREARAFKALSLECEVRRCREVALSVAAEERLDFVAFLVHRREDFRMARRVAELLREERPEVCQVVFGPHIDLYGTVALASAPVFDGGCVGDYELGLAALSERINRREEWGVIPDFLYRTAGGLRRTGRDVNMDLDFLAAPCYERAVYPAVHTTGKLRLFTLEHSRGLHHSGNYRPVPEEGARPVRVRSASRMCDEMEGLSRLFGARAYLVNGVSTPSAQIDVLSQEILSRRLKVHYVRAGHILCAGAAAFPLMALSGCSAIEFRVDTGSQRLLEDYYGHDFGVTDIERLFRASRDAGLLRVMHLSYPCPKDDQHTRAETLRLVRRCKPDAASVGAPELVPGSWWYVRGLEFGYRIDPAAYSRWVTGEDLIPGGVEASAYRMPGWPETRVAAEREALVREYAELGVAGLGSAGEALVARMTGYEGEEGEFAMMSRERLFTGDAAGVAKLVDDFNRHGAPASAAPFRPFVPVLAAVGN